MKTKLMACICGAALMTAPALAQDQSAMATFMNTEGEEVGSAELMQTEAGVEITATVSGLTEGEHGFHIHETGDCDPSNGFDSAGGHYNPTDNQHGFDNPEGPHAGDMENQVADVDGNLSADVVNDRVSLIEGEEGYLFDEDGSALMIHAEADDYMTDPGGDAGSRVACAVVEPADGM
ncbi:superoxide dismutase [Cu-Zn] 2 [Devosia pacifica]|uniref:Superoxide dismutase [Cu-Zn] n=1 Tax=Devosia pacifica TaxID=1335967 RepID=A0A918RYJ5_9HYPH|nr:superoxide dismutase family protein [Devosia pacifica]GHA16002.1 superoxide dismutase [Cu-Zn] 2 [Devosia pacifica]